MKRHPILLFAILFFALAKPFFAGATPIYGLTTGNLLLRFDSAAPGAILQALAVTGLQSGEVLQAIDFRPLSNELLGLGNSNRVYLISTNTGAASVIGSTSFGTLSGSAFGFDANPNADRIRVVSDAEQNFRLNPTNGALLGPDQALAYAVADPHSGANPNIVGCAYLNNFPGAPLTSLYGIDSDLDILVTQIPPNNGTLNTVGALGLDIGPLCGFDISATNEALAAMTAPGGVVSRLFKINLNTGLATLVGDIGGGALIVGLAIVPVPMVRFASTQYSGAESAGTATIRLTRFGGSAGAMTVNYSTAPGTATAGADYQPVSGSVLFADGETEQSFDVPIVNDAEAELNETVLLTLSAPATNGPVGGVTNAVLEIVSAQELPVYVLTVSNQLLRFSTSPAIIQSTITITGLQSGEILLGIDFRPATGQLFGLGNSNSLYAIDPTVGAATAVVGAGFFTLSGTDFGFDFNPMVDRIRVTSDLEQNFRLNPVTGTPAGIDAFLAYAVGDSNYGVDPNVVASAYDHNFAGATSTVLYGIDSGLDILVIQTPPNNGTLNTVGALGVDISGTAGLDYTEGDKSAYAVFKRSAAATSEIYRVDLATGLATLMGAVNSPTLIRDLAIPEPQPALKIALAGTNSVLSWSAASLGYTLEATLSLSVPDWVTNLPAPVIISGEKVVTNALSTTHRFFRLKK